MRTYIIVSSPQRSRLGGEKDKSEVLCTTESVVPLLLYNQSVLLYQAKKYRSAMTLLKTIFENIHGTRTGVHRTSRLLLVSRIIRTYDPHMFNVHSKVSRIYERNESCYDMPTKASAKGFQ